MKKSVRVSWAAGCLVLSTLAYATPVTWRFDGVVDTPNAGAYFFPFVLQENDPITFGVTFEPQTPCSLCNPHQTGFDNAVTSVTMTARGMTVALPVDHSSLGLMDDYQNPISQLFFDSFGIYFTGLDHGTGIFYTGSFDLSWASPTPPVPGINQTTLANLAPPDPGLLHDLNDNSFFFTTAGLMGGFDSFRGHMSTISAAVVPEPSELPLWAAGGLLAVVMGMRRRGRLANA